MNCETNKMITEIITTGKELIAADSAKPEGANVF